MAGWIKAILMAAGWLTALSGARAQEPVDVALVLAVDVSRSMSRQELTIQRDGYAAALNHPDVVRAIAQGAYGRIAVTMFEWAGTESIRQVFDWTLVETGADADRLSAIVAGTRPVAQRRTSISGAILHALDRLDASPYEGFRKVIDVSGDGPNNQGEPVLEAREVALSKRIIINGLPLMTTGGFYGRYSIPYLDRYYVDCVIGGPASFSLPVKSWEEFPEAVRRKLVLELAGHAMRESELPLVRVAQEEKTDCLIGERLLLQWDFNDR